MKPGLSLPAADTCPSLPSIRGFPPHMDCIPFLLRQAKEALELTHLGRPNQVTVMRQVLLLMSKLDWTETPPFMSQAVHRQIRQLTGNPDPYAGVKRAMNRKAARLCSQWRPRFQDRYGPLEAAVRLSIAGNLMDSGAKTQPSENGMEAALERALTARLHGSLKCEVLREALNLPVGSLALHHQQPQPDHHRRLPKGAEACP